MIAQSQSGTGKTAAFALTMLSRIVPENRYPQAICLAPTYELAVQIGLFVFILYIMFDEFVGEVVNKMARYMPDVKVHYAVKGTPRRKKNNVKLILFSAPWLPTLRTDHYWYTWSYD